MKLNKPGVDGGEELAANIVGQHARVPKTKTDQGNDIAARDKPIQHPHIKAAKALEAVVESALEAPEEAGIILVVPRYSARSRMRLMIGTSVLEIVYDTSIANTTA